MYAAIQDTLNTIRNLPICELSKRQPMLIDLLVSLVDSETSQGEGTSSGSALEYQDWWHTLSSLTADAGFTRLGNGHFSAAYSHEMLPGKVIKVGFKKEDSGAAYVAFCRMHQGRAGIPVIHDVQRHPSCYTVVMDKLSPLGDEDARDEAGMSNLWWLVPQAVQSSDKGWEGWKSSMPEEYGALNQHELETIETCRMIHKFFYGIASFDMHSGNAMVNSKGQLVITDPVSYTEKGGPLERCENVIDPEALLAEIEQQVMKQAIERAKRRKAMRDPNSTERAVKRARGRRWKRLLKRKAKVLKEERLLEAKRVQEGREMEAFQVRNGTERLWQVVANNSFEKAQGILHIENRKHVEVDNWAIAQGLQVLRMDKVLQARFIG